MTSPQAAGTAHISAGKRHAGSARIVRIDGFELSCDLPEVIGNAMRFSIAARRCWCA